MSRGISVLTILVVALACGKSGDGGPCTNCPSPSIAITLSRTALTAAQGGSDNLTATITRAGGFTGAVTIVTEGAPSSVSAAASNVTTAGTVTTGTITVTVGAAVTPGVYNLTVRATGSGVSAVTQALTLTVTATPAIALALGANAQSVTQGTTGAAVTVTLTRTNHTGTINLTVEGAPAGVTPAFTPAAVTLTSSSLTLGVGGAVAPGVYNLTIRAASTGVTDATAPFTLTVTPTASYTLGATPVTINQGAQGQSTVTLTRVSFPDVVTLSLEGAPAGVTSSFNPAAPTGNTSTLTLTVGAAVTPGPHTLTVRGVAAGLTDRTTTFVLTVNEVVQGSYTLSTSPSPELLVATASGGTAFVVTVNRTGGFTGPVTLSTSGLLSSLTATITPSVVTGNSAVVAVVPDLSNQVGSTSVTITGTTPGLADRTAPLQVTTVVPDMTFDYSTCVGSTPVALWYQDGDAGPWVQLLPLGGRFKIKLSQPKVGFAVSTPAFGGGGLPPWVRLRSAAELKAMSGSQFCDDGNPGPNNVAVSVINMPTIFDQAFIALGGAQRSASTGLPNVTLMGARAGTHDLVAHSQNQSGGAPGAAHRIIVRRSLNTSVSPIAPALNFSPAGEGSAPIATTITVSGLAGGEVVNGTGTQFFTAGTGSCDAAPLYSVFFGSAIASFPIYGLPPAIPTLATDRYGVNYSTQSPGTFRSITEYFPTFGPRTIALGSAMPAPVISSIPGSTFRLQFVMTLPGDLTGGGVFANYVLSNGRFAFLDASAAWIGGSSVTLTMPDFTGTAGFDPATLPPPAGATNWTVSAQGAPVDPCSGGRFASANRTGVFP